MQHSLLRGMVFFCLEARGSFCSFRAFVMDTARGKRSRSEKGKEVVQNDHLEPSEGPHKAPRVSKDFPKMNLSMQMLPKFSSSCVLLNHLHAFPVNKDPNSICVSCMLRCCSEARVMKWSIHSSVLSLSGTKLSNLMNLLTFNFFGGIEVLG